MQIRLSTITIQWANLEESKHSCSMCYCAPVLLLLKEKLCHLPIKMSYSFTAKRVNSKNIQMLNL